MKNILTRCLAAHLALALFVPSLVAQTRRAPRRAPASTVAPTPARTPQPSPAPSTVRARASAAVAANTVEPGGEIDDLVARGTYAVFYETRALVEHLDSPLVTESLAPLRAAGIVPKETILMMDFMKIHRLSLSQSRAVLFGIPLKSGLPQFLFALETPNADDARTLEPEIKRLVKKLTPSINAATASPTKPRTTTTRRNRRTPDDTSATGLRTMRVGRTLIVSDAPVKLNALRPANTPSFIADAQMRDMRSRFTPATAFIYFDANGLRAFMAAKSSSDKTQNTAVLSGETPMGNVAVAVDKDTGTIETVNVSGDISSNVTTPEPQSAQDAITPEIVTITGPPTTGGNTNQADNDTEVQAEIAAPEAPPAPSEIDGLSSLAFPALFSSFTRGYESVEAVGAAFNLDSDAASVRVLIANKEGIPVGPIPLMPIIVSGAPLATNAASLMPSDTGVFVSLSLDMPRMYDELVGAAKTLPPSGTQSTKTSAANTGTNAEALSPLEARIVGIESRYGFKVRDELLAAFGNEIAFGVSEKYIAGELLPSAPPDDEDAEAKTTSTITTSQPDSVASASGNDKTEKAKVEETPPSSMGMYFLISVRDKARLQRLLPVALEIMGIKVPKEINLIQRRDGIESVMFTNNMVSFIGDYLLITPDAVAANGVIKAFREGANLSSDSRFTAARSWQKQEKLGELYFSNALVKTLINMSQKSVLAAIGNAPNPYAGGDIEPNAITYTITSDPLGAQHELRIPINAVRLFSQISSLAGAHQEIITNDAAAQSALYSIFSAQMERRYKNAEGADGEYDESEEQKTESTPFVSLEELKDKGDDKEDRAERFTAKGYRIEMRAGGDKFEATATPEAYGKTGRRSFFIDEKGSLRGGDLAGRNANASDKRIN